MKSILYKYPRLRRYFSRVSSLVMLIQKSPVVQLLIPEARLFSSIATADAVKMTIATVAGLGAFDSVTGATEVVQLSPVSGSHTVPATSGTELTFVFQATGTGGHKVLSFQVTGTLPAGLSLTPGVQNRTIGSITGSPTQSGTFPNIRIRGYENSDNSGRYSQGFFTINVQPGTPSPASITTHPAAVSIFRGSSTTLNVTADGSPPFTYQWYQGPQGNTTTPVGANSSSFTTATLTATTDYWVKVSNALNPSGALSNSATVTVDPRFEFCAASKGGSIGMVVAPGGQQDNRVPANAIDGIIDNNHRWAVNGFPSSIEFDMGENKAISRTEYYPYKGRSYQYIVEAKLEGGTYTQVVDRSANTTLGTDNEANPITDEFTPVIARYLRVTISDINNSTSNTCSINEFRAYGISADEQLTKDWNELHFTAQELSDDNISGPTADPDHDGVSNADEYIFGTSPQSGEGQLVPVVSQATPQLNVSFQAASANGTGYTGKTRHYAIQATDDLTLPSSWSDVAGFTDIIGNDQMVNASIPADGATKKFYRISTWLTP